MATQKELDEQKALTDAKIAQQEKAIRDSYNLAQSQLKDKETEAKGMATKLAQQAYITKQQTERVQPNVLSAMGLAQTGYENVKKQRTNQAYKGQVGEVESNLQSTLSDYSRQDASQDLAYQQNMEAINLDRQAAALDYTQALARLNSQSSGSGYQSTLSESQSNAQLITRQLNGFIKEGKADTNTAAQAVKGYYDGGYIDYNDYINSTRAVKQLADAVAQKNASKPTTKQTPKQITQSTKYKKAEALRQW